jgi:putative SOS response-associated peptidase YedK
MCGRFAVTTDPAALAEKIQAINEAVGDDAGRAAAR